MWKPGQLVTIKTVFGNKVYRIVKREFIEKLLGAYIEEDDFQRHRIYQKNSESFSKIYKNVPENCVLGLLQEESKYKKSKRILVK